MSSRLSDELPADFVTTRENGAVTICRSGRMEVLEVFDRPGGAFGRGVPVRARTPAGAPVIHKRFFRGGLVRFLKDRYLSWRPLRREIAVAEHLRTRGVGAPEILAARARRDGLGWWRLEILSREIPSAIRLSDVACGRPGRARADRLRAVAREVRRLHDAGIEHGDLNVENILWSGDAVFFVDFDRSRRLDPVPPRGRARDLRRLLRSARKRRLPLSRTDLLRFALAYGEPDLLARMGLRPRDLFR